MNIHIHIHVLRAFELEYGLDIPGSNMNLEYLLHELSQSNHVMTSIDKDRATMAVTLPPPLAQQ
jgi:hypothetical protein